jgi:hypothetical protein
VVIVDEFTGRLMPGRRFSDGLHQALEAKEGVKVEAENQTLASITFQNFFRMYEKLAGMTGTADTEAVEFQQIYGLEVMVAPPNKPMVRKDFPDVIFKTQVEKFAAIVEEIQDCTPRGSRCWSARPPSRSPSTSPALLKKKGIPHEVLNAKYHEKEAEIVARPAERPRDHRHQHGRPRHGHQAGRRGARAWRPAHPGHRAAREPAHRQPVARPRRTSGRSGLLALLPGPGRHADAHLRLGAHRRHHGKAGPGGRADHREPAHQPVHRKCPEAGRRPQLRDPQAAASNTTTS